MERIFMNRINKYFKNRVIVSGARSIKVVEARVDQKEGEAAELERWYFRDTQRWDADAFTHHIVCSNNAKLHWTLFVRVEDDHEARRLNTVVGTMTIEQFWATFTRPQSFAVAQGMASKESSLFRATQHELFDKNVFSKEMLSYVDDVEGDLPPPLSRPEKRKPELSAMELKEQLELPVAVREAYLEVVAELEKQRRKLENYQTQAMPMVRLKLERVKQKVSEAKEAVKERNTEQTRQQLEAALAEQKEAKEEHAQTRDAMSGIQDEIDDLKARLESFHKWGAFYARSPGGLVDIKGKPHRVMFSGTRGIETVPLPPVVAVPGVEGFPQPRMFRNPETREWLRLKEDINERRSLKPLGPNYKLYDAVLRDEDE